MGRLKRPYKRKKGSPKQKKELNSFNIFTDELVFAYHKIINEENTKKHKK